MRLIAGRIYEGLPGARTLEGARFAELRLTDPLPRASTLRRWRAGLGSVPELALSAPRAAFESTRGCFRADPPVLDSLRWALEAAEALGAGRLVFRPRAAFTPGSRDRQALIAYTAHLPRRPGLRYVWVPGGLWEPETAYPLCAELSMQCAFDPLEWPAPPAADVFARLPGLGLRANLSDTTLLGCVHKLQAAQAVQRAVMVLEAVRSNGPVRRLQRLADDSSADANATFAES